LLLISNIYNLCCYYIYKIDKKLKKTFIYFYSKNKNFMIYYICLGGNYMGTNWTDKQTYAIYEKGSNLLVAAAARKW